MMDTGDNLIQNLISLNHSIEENLERIDAIKITSEHFWQKCQLEKKTTSIILEEDLISSNTFHEENTEHKKSSDLSESSKYPDKEEVTFCDSGTQTALLKALQPRYLNVSRKAKLKRCLSLGKFITKGCRSKFCGARINIHRAEESYKLNPIYSCLFACVGLLAFQISCMITFGVFAVSISVVKKSSLY